MSHPPPRTLSVLLVEDSPADGRLLLEAFKPAVAAGEIIVQTVKNLALAAEALKRDAFSCVLLDLGLPDGHGVQSVRALRDIDPKTAIIVLTGLADEKLATEALTLGAQDYLVKGESDGEQLLKQLRRATQRNRQTYALETRRDQAFFEASHDALTLLPNAALFADRARQQLALARIAAADGKPNFTLAYLRVEGLAPWRERHEGHRADEVLKTFAERLSGTLQAADTMAHIAIDTFALLCPAASEREWAARLHDCQQTLAGLEALSPHHSTLALHTALVKASDALDGVDALLAKAAEAATPPKLLAPTPRTPEPVQPLIEASWQPWVDANTRRCMGLSLQTETQHPDPATHALMAAASLVQQAKTWASAKFEAPLLSLEISLAALQSEAFVTAFCELFATAGLAPHRVQLEIEEAVFQQLPQHHTALTRLRGRGFKLLLSAGGSQDISLHHFAAFALDGYQLSPAAVRTLIDDNLQGTARRLISAILGAAQQLGAVVIATGVDSDEAVAALQLVGVRYLQGRALLPPLAPEQVPLACERLSARASAAPLYRSDL